MSNQGTLTKSGSGIPFIFFDSDSPEWEKMWSNLYDQYSNHRSATGEVWQYMGTWKTDCGWVHQFRHRNYNGERKYVDIVPTNDFMANIPNILAAKEAVPGA